MNSATVNLHLKDPKPLRVSRLYATPPDAGDPDLIYVNTGVGILLMSVDYAAELAQMLNGYLANFARERDLAAKVVENAG